MKKFVVTVKSPVLASPLAGGFSRICGPHKPHEFEGQPQDYTWNGMYNTNPGVTFFVGPPWPEGYQPAGEVAP